MGNASDGSFAVHFSTQPFTKFGGRVGLFWRLAWIVNRLITRTTWDHVAVETPDGLVITGEHESVLVVQAATYRRIRRVLWSSRVREAQPIDAWRHREKSPTNRLSVGLRLLTLGRVPARDCVSVARDVLGDAGVRVPDNIVTPKGLAKWIRDYPNDSDPYSLIRRMKQSNRCERSTHTPSSALDSSSHTRTIPRQFGK